MVVRMYLPRVGLSFAIFFSLYFDLYSVCCSVMCTLIFIICLPYFFALFLTQFFATSILLNNQPHQPHNTHLVPKHQLCNHASILRSSSSNHASQQQLCGEFANFNFSCKYCGNCFNYPILV